MHEMSSRVARRGLVGESCSVTVTLWSGALAAVSAAAVVSWAIHRSLSAEERRRFASPGELVDVGGGRLHVHTTGEGAPSVVLDSALAGTSLSWGEVQTRTAELTRVVSTDRLGFGWSDPTRAPRRVDVLVEELHRALEAADIEPPYVLVGHSYGGFVVRLFAAIYPRETAGLVLVDAPHPREWMTPSLAQARRIERGVLLARGGAVLARFGLTRILFRLAGRGLVLGASAPGEQGRIAELLGKVPAPLRETIRSFWVRSETLAALASLIENVPASAARVHRSSVDLGSLPLRVLTASNPSPERRRDQDEVAKLSSRGRHVVAANSGHWIPLDEPELVVEAIRSVLDELRSREPRDEETAPALSQAPVELDDAPPRRPRMGINRSSRNHRE
jgi:pimeloyl-ACP methyl ester carboxylesterase